MIFDMHYYLNMKLPMSGYDILGISHKSTWHIKQIITQRNINSYLDRKRQPTPSGQLDLVGEQVMTE